MKKLTEHEEIETPDPSQAYVWLIFTNTGSGACTVQGYPGYQMVGANGRLLPTHLQDRPGFPTDPVVLQPQEKAMASVYWSLGGNTPPPCYQPATIRVFPNRDNDMSTVEWAMAGYCGPITMGPYKHDYS